MVAAPPVPPLEPVCLDDLDEAEQAELRRIFKQHEQLKSDPPTKTESDDDIPF